MAVGVVVMCGVLLGTAVVWSHVALSRLETRLAAQRAESQRQHEAGVQQDVQARRTEIERAEAAHRARLEDPAFRSGALAESRHEAEWKLRLAHSPQMVSTALETNLLEMDRLGRDETVVAKVALETVARMAAPKGSRVEVVPQNDRFVVRVAFSMSVLNRSEAGAVTLHTSRESLRREIEELSARVMRDLYDSCGWRGIEKLSVSCNHALYRPLPLRNATPEEKEELSRRAPPTMGKLYRMSLAQEQARVVPDWRRISTPQVIQMLAVEYDGVKNLTITAKDYSRTGARSDPAGPLEF